MGEMNVFTLVSSANRARVAASKTADGAYALAAAINKRAGNPTLVHVGESVEYAGRGALVLDGVSVPLNPPMGGKSDPNGWMLDKIVENATAGKAAARKTSTAATGSKGAGTRATVGKAAPTRATRATGTAGKTTAGKATAARATRAKAGAAAS